MNIFSKTYFYYNIITILWGFLYKGFNNKKLEWQKILKTLRINF